MARDAAFPAARLLFPLTLALAACFALVVAAAPFVDDPAARPHGVGKVAAVFARDAALRRTTLASAVGLTVAAFVFFRPSVAGKLPPTREPSRPTTPPVVGA